jgi:O-antigen/teichoic acid export membrane protein
MTSLAGQHQLGLYVAAVNLSEIPLIVNVVVGQMSFASDSAKNDDDRLTTIARLLGFFSIVVGALIAITLPITIPLLFGSAFYPAATSIVILLAGIVIGAPVSVAGGALGARGHPGLRSLALVLAATVNLGLLMVAVPRMGAVGASMATLGGNLVAGTFALVAIRRVSGISPLAFWGIRRTDLKLLRDVVAARGVMARNDPLDGMKSNGVPPESPLTRDPISIKDEEMH